MNLKDTRQDVRACTEFIRLRIQSCPAKGPREHGYESSGSISGEEYVSKRLSAYQVGLRSM
jgi:hypothetical protein